MTEKIKEDLFVTVITDASHCPKTKASGYGCWIKYSNGKTQKLQGMFTSNNSTEAESFGLNVAIDWLNQNSEIITNKIIVIQCDNISALENVNKTELEKVCRFVKLKHVKSHAGYVSPRNSVNMICDKMAKDQMRKMRSKLMAEL